MRALFTTLLLCLALSASAQVQSKWFAVGDITSATNQGGGAYSANITLSSDQSGNGYNGTSLTAGYRAITSAGRNYSVTSITTPGATTLTIVLQNLEAVAIAPTGRVVLYEYSGTDPYIPVGAINSSGVSSAFSAIIINHNFKTVPTGGGGAGTVSTDATLTGDGATGTELKVDTTIIATRNYVLTTIDATGQKSVEFYATGGETSLSIPFQIDATKPMVFERNGQGLSIGASRQVTLSGTTFNINGPALEAGERIQAIVFQN